MSSDGSPPDGDAPPPSGSIHDAETADLRPGTGPVPSTAPPTVAESWPSATGAPAPIAASTHPRYRIGEVIGRGGMGEVVSAHDEQIGRSVAIKRLRSATPSPVALARFLREARIQGRLEHPAVVPVHELWHDDTGRPLFVMKQLSGTTLADVIARLAAGDAAATARFTRQRLLRAFVDVCLAVEFAHTRGVIHRDLKPANIVLGEFGEVYVLDWGIARVTGDDDARGGFADVDTVEGTETAAGAVLGTAGYISPEQVRSDPDLDGRADVFALGCILYELLALQALHPRGQAGLASALSPIDARPSTRAPDRDIPPELDSICVRATAIDRGERYPTARQLGDTVQAYLDGDRDVALRRDLVQTELAVARAALASGDGTLPRRAAIRAAARALALDPTAREPADLIGRLMIEPPAEVPREVEAQLAQLDLAALSTSARFGTVTAIAYLTFFPLLYWIGFHDAWYLIAGPAICAFIIFVERVVAPRNPFWSGYLAIGGHLLMIVLLARITTPIMIGAGPATIMVMLLAAHPNLIRTWVLAALAGLASVTPWLLQLAGVGAPTTTITGNSMVLHTAAGHLDPAATMVGIILYFVALLTLATVLSRSQDNERRAARRALQIQAWQLGQLIPKPVSVPPVASAS